ncbi:glycosyltransferase family 4 protein [Halomicroarcula limicola]|uniref:Glycosyltransferase family 4 protein n=1 Tax=Haloarcula limicola TaxID=1429915 RepID=A0A8J7Y5Q4_9EURY|nr:glycosyltransferase family 4 protein [Halomicroarcula limicola]MBV0925215.1 glycosyltransferase family 4 protein [Halomicroarcula limicola]
MHIVQIHTRYYPHLDGVGSTIRAISRELVSNGHRVTVLCSKITPSEPLAETIEGVDVRRVPTSGRISDTELPLTLPKVLAGVVSEADVLHTHLPTPWTADVSAVLGAVTNTPVVLTYHNDLVGTGIQDILAKTYNRTALQATLRLVDKILITQPDYLGDSAHLAPFESKVETVYNGVDIDFFQPTAASSLPEGDFPSGSSMIFFLALLDENHTYKGLDVLLKAIGEIARREDNVPHLFVGGDGGLKPEYEAMARQLEITDHVTFLGRVPESDLPTYYSLADTFVLPSLSSAQEGFGLVLLEALACGTPVIATPVVGIADDIRAEPIGTLVPKNDPEKLASAIRKMIAGQISVESERMTSLCENKYSWSSSVAELEDIYQALVEANDTGIFS